MHHITAPIQYVQVQTSWPVSIIFGILTTIGLLVLLAFLLTVILEFCKVWDEKTTPHHGAVVVAVSMVALLGGVWTGATFRSTPHTHQVRTIEQDRWTVDQITKTYQVKVLFGGLAPVTRDGNRTESTFFCSVNGIYQTCRAAYFNIRLGEGKRPGADTFDMTAFDAAGIELPLRKG